MSFLSSLTTGSPATTSSNQSTTTPAWYQDTMRGITAQGINAASRPFAQYQGPRVAGWSPMQLGALDQIQQSQGAWNAPVVAGINALSNLPGQVAPTLQAAGQAAGSAASAIGPARNWTNEYQQYMSPYTSAVVDEIGRLGTRNLTENLLPAVNNSFIGAGGFGSTRNAEILGRTMRDANADILGQQAGALERGYGTSANIFNADANRSLQTGSQIANTQLQGATTALNAARTWADTLNTATQGMAGLAQQGQNMQGTDINRLIYAGNQHQGQVQKQLDVNYGDFREARDWDMNQLGALSQLIKGFQIPTNQVSNQSAMPAGTSPLGWLSALVGLFGASGAAPGGTTPPAGTP